jgi:Putative auto-transporter adhesin, head GIN domain
MSRTLLLIIPAAVAAFAFAGCAIGDDGATTSQNRNVAAFTRVDSPDSVDVRLQVGKAQHVRVRAGEKVIDDVKTDVVDGTLRVRFDHHGLGGNSVVVEASVPSLTAVKSTGSGDLEATGIDGDALDVRSDGSGDVVLGGTIGRLGVDVSGSGDADLADLRAGSAKVASSGSGNVDVRAAKALDVTMDGSGDVRYHGNPTLHKSDDGSGDLNHAS